MSSVIEQHNSKASSAKIVDRLCDFRRKNICPLDDNCLRTCIVSKDDVCTNKNSHIYYGAIHEESESRYNNHTNKFCHRYHEQDTEPLKYILQLQDNGINSTLKWSIAAYASTYRSG